MQHAVEAPQPDRHHGHSQSRSYHADPRLEGPYFSGQGALTLRENQNRPAFTYEVPDMTDSFA